jgi:hypothetical protein
MNPPASPPVFQPPSETKTSSAAIWSLILGILSITCLWLLGSIPAIILGILSIKKINASGGSLTGKGMGVAGIVTGSVGIFTGIAVFGILAATALPSYVGIQNRALQTKEMTQVRMILIGCIQFANEKDGRFPENLSQLVDEEILNEADLRTQAVAEGMFLYRSGLNNSSPAEEPIVASPAAIDGKRILGRVDGSTLRVPEEEFQANYAELFPSP